MWEPVALAKGVPRVLAEAHRQHKLSPQTQRLLCPECLATQMQRAPPSLPCSQERRMTKFSTLVF